jgi:hypothetical protein
VQAVQSIAADPAEAAAEDKVECDILGLSPAAAPAVWPYIAPFIQRARESVPAMVAARELLDDIREKAERGVYQLWTVYRGQSLIGAFATSLDTYSRMRVCTIQYLGGHDLDDWIDHLDATVCQWAAINDCQQVEFRGRSGWRKKVDRLGGVMTGIACVKEV